MSKKSATTYTVLQLCFKLRVPPDVLLAESGQAATAIASVEGLIWKIWISRAEKSEIGGVYLFATPEAAEAYLKHPVIEALCRNPAVVCAHSQVWEVERSLSAVTRAPLANACTQSSQPEARVAGGR